jgi:hypothetical protein
VDSGDLTSLAELAPGVCSGEIDEMKGGKKIPSFLMVSEVFKCNIQKQ